MPGNTRTLDDPLPDFVEEYIETKVDPIIVTLRGIEFWVKDAKDTEKAKELFENLRIQAPEQMKAHTEVGAQLDALEDDDVATRAYDAVTAKETTLRDLLKRLSPLLKDLKGGRRRAKTGRRVRKGTRRGRRGHF